MKKEQTRKKAGAVSGTRRFPLIATLVVAAIMALAVITVVSKQVVKGNGGDAGKGPNNAETPGAVAENSGKQYITVKVAGRDVQVDPQTGQIKPLTPEEAKRLADGLKVMLNNSTEGLVEVHHTDGSVSMDLQGRFQHVMVARIEADGTLIQSCIDTPEAAASFFGIEPQLLGVEPTRGAATQQPVRSRPPKAIR
jgi:hypothetical protein